MGKSKKETIRRVILAELSAQNKTIYWLAKQMGAHRQSVYRALQGDGFSSGLAGQMLDVLGLQISRKETHK